MPAKIEGSRRVSRLKARHQAATVAKAAIATKAVGYVRVSTEEQATHGHGLDSQERAIRAFADSQGYELVTVIADPGVSGATRPDERAGYRQIAELAEGRAFSVLLVWKFDRLARQIVFAVTAVNDLAERLGVVLRSVTEPIDTATPMGKTVFAILAGMAEQEREAITDRTHLGRREKAAKGGFAGGPAPFGYERDKEGGLRIVAAEAVIVRRMLAERRDGRTLQEIADGLNRDGLPTRRNGRWRPGRVGYVLDNPKYRGLIEYLFRRGGEAHILERGTHEPIVAPA